MTARHADALVPRRPGDVSRRYFLRGLGACIALPGLESLGPERGRAQASTTALATTRTGVPLRTAFIFFPNGAIPSRWWPTGEGRDFAFSPSLQPLQSLRAHIQVLGGLDHKTAYGGTDGGGDHARSNATFLTGVRPNKSATDIRAGTSIDQLVAREIGDLTRFPSLELTCSPARPAGACDAGYACAYLFNLSWASPRVPRAPEANPRMLFERLFGSGDPGQRTENMQRRLGEDRSVLDFVLQDAHDMQRRLDARDRDKLDQYLTGVREIEARIQRSERFGAVKDPGVATPPAIPRDHGEYVQLMYDLLGLAFHSDATRVATFLLAPDGSNRSFPEIGIPDGHHDLSHHLNDPGRIEKVAEIDRWYVKQFAAFLEKLQGLTDVDGHSLLHNSMILYGGGIADGNRHTHSNLPLILAGAGGGALTPGRYAIHDSKPTTNLFLSLLDRLGIGGVERFGDSTGRITDV